MLLWAISFERCLFRGAFLRFRFQKLSQKSSIFHHFLKSEFFVKTMFLHQNRKGCFRFFRSKKRKHDILKKHSAFRYTMVTARAIPQTRGKPKAVSRTLKTEYHSLGRNDDTSVIRGPAIKKAGWLRGQ